MTKVTVSHHISTHNIIQKRFFPSYTVKFVTVLLTTHILQFNGLSFQSTQFFLSICSRPVQYASSRGRHQNISHALKHHPTVSFSVRRRIQSAAERSEGKYKRGAEFLWSDAIPVTYQCWQHSPDLILSSSTNNRFPRERTSLPFTSAFQRQ